MVTPKFKQVYQKLNKSQKEAVDIIEGPVMVIAGPGTGKTQILTIRIANILLKTQVNPENILALTFTESGVLEMRKRLVEIIGSEGYKVEINTFHGFSNNIIQANPEDFPHLISAQSLTEIEQLGILEQILVNTQFESIKPLGDPLFYLKQILSVISDLKKEGVDSQKFALAIERQEDGLTKVNDLYHEKGPYKGQVKGKYLDIKREIGRNKELLRIYEGYQNQLRENKKYDFSDMLIEVISTLKKNTDLKLRIQERYQYILIDEHQDTNTAQNQLVELLTSFYENPNLFVVGDEKQAIYRFQGATLENFLYFQKLYQGAKLVNLEENYRSTQLILNAAASLISKNITSEILAKSLSLKANVDYPNELVRIATLSDYYIENYFVAKDIKQKLDQKIKPEEIAILTRNNKDLTQFSVILEQFGISYSMMSDQNIFVDADARKLILIFEAVCNFGSDPELNLALHVDFLGIDQLDIYKLMVESKSQKIALYDLLSNEKLLNKLTLSNKKNILNFYQQLKNWKSSSDNENLPEVFTEILWQSGILGSIAKKANYLDILDRIVRLFDEAKFQWERNPKFNLSDFLSYLRLLQKHEILIKKPIKPSLQKGVRLMTAHRAKGLEFDFVYIVNCFDGHWGNLKKRAGGFKVPWEFLGVKLQLNIEIDLDEDERRLFYVALTRAKKGLIISYSTCSLDGREQLPSKFISEIDSKYKKDLDLSEFEDDFIAHRELIFSPPVEVLAKSLEKEFFKKLFFERGISATGLNNFLDCPWKYFYTNLLVLPQAHSKSAIFGSTVHQAISIYINQIKNYSPKVEFLIEPFVEALKKQMTEVSINFVELKLKGQEILKIFYQSEAKNWPKTLLAEKEIRGVHLDADILLNGKIDMIEPIKGTQVRVYDFKTGDIRSRNQIMGLTRTSSGDYFRQLTFYKLLLDQEGRLKMQEGVIQFIEPDKRGKLHKEVFEITDEDIKNLESQIKQVSSEIINLSFWNKNCGKSDCSYCNLRKLMI